MDGDIFNSVLGRINTKLVRRILLLMDNAGCHPTNLSEKHSNIKVVFLPPNTTSRLQPLDLGIIKTFKTHYRKLFLRYVLTKVDQCSTATEISKSLTILQAIYWTSGAWKAVQDSTVIQKCYRKCGVLDKDFNVVQESILNEDPFCDLDTSMQAVEPRDPELTDLVQHICGDNECYYDDNIDVPTCFDLDDDNWQEKFFQELGPSTAKKPCGGQDQEDQDESDVEAVDCTQSLTGATEQTSSINTYRDALNAIEDLTLFFQNKRHFTEANEMMEFSTRVTSLYCSQLSSARQATLMEFFKP